MRRRAELGQAIYRSDPWTAVKHRVYRGYLGCWMAKILQKFPRAVIVDAFAGAGTYEDGVIGSTPLMAQTYLTHQARPNLGHLHIIAVEVRTDRARELERQLAMLPQDASLTTEVWTEQFDLELVRKIRTRIAALAPGMPTLWVLDPYNTRSLDYATIRECLTAPKDELLLTFFVEHMNRHALTPSFQGAMDRLFGDDSWRVAANLPTGPGKRKAFVDAFQLRLASERLLTSSFGVVAGGSAPKYEIVYATHHTAGLECFVPVRWRLDVAGGIKASIASVDQLSFMDPALDALLDHLRGFGGTSASWDDLVQQARRIGGGFLDSHLREALTLLRVDGIAVRESPLELSRQDSEWPRDSMIRFYDPQLVAESKQMLDSAPDDDDS